MFLFAKWTSKHDGWKRLGGIFSQYRKWTRSLQIIPQFYQKSYLKDISDVPDVLANNMETWFLIDQNVEKLFESNNKDAGTCMVLHAPCKNNNAVIVSKDTNVLILL